MRSRSRRALIGGSAAVLAVPLLALPAAAGSPGSSRVPVQTASPAASGHALGATSKTKSISFSVVLKMRDAAGAEALAMAVSDPNSASYRHFLTPAQWRQSYAPTAKTVQAVTSWLRSQRLSVTDSSANHRILTVTGSAGAVESAFGTTLKDFARGGEVVHAQTSAVSVPSSLAGAIDEVAGLDETDAVRPTATLPGPPPVFKNAPPCSTYYGQKIATSLPPAYGQHQPYAPCGYTPTQLRGAYGTDAAIARGIDGRGSTVAIVDAYASPTILKDANRYSALHGVPPFNGNFNQNNAAAFTHQQLCGPQGWYGEETLDVEAVHGMAPGANVLYVGGASCLNVDLAAAVNKIVDRHLADVISNSYGSLGEHYSRIFHQAFVQAAAEGIGVFFSSGDSGDEIVRTGRRQVDSPASDPFVTAVGGTSLGVGQSNNYLFETGWGTGRSVLYGHAWIPAPPGTFQYGGGGGTSQLYREPGYQKGVVPGTIANFFGQGPHRAVPDVAAVGDPSTGMLVGETQQFPGGKDFYSEYRIGGTSLSCPLVAGIEALANQVNGGSLGFANPKLYSLYKTDAFHDVKGQGVTRAVVRVDYANGVNASAGTITSLRSMNFTGTIVVRPGYDDVTGLGTPNGLAYLNGLAH